MPGEVRGQRGGVAGGCWVIMGRALDAGSPFQDNGFSNRPAGHAPAGSGPGDHGACGRARMPGEVRGQRGGVAGGCWVIMRRALGGRIPVRSNGFPNLRRLGAHGACGRLGSARPGSRAGVGGTRQLITGHALGGRIPLAQQTDSRIGAGPCVVEGGQVIMGRAFKVRCPLRGNGFSNRPIGHAPAGSGRVRMAAARSAGSPRCAAAPGL